MNPVDGSILWIDSVGLEFKESADDIRAKLKHRKWVRLTDLHGYTKWIRVNAVTFISDRQAVTS